MDLEPPAELEAGEPIKSYLITTPCDLVLSAGLDAQWFRHITLICEKKKKNRLNQVISKISILFERPQTEIQSKQ